MKEKISLRHIISSKCPLLVGGAFDGLSASLVHRAGFDAVWASGFGISASKAIPDMNLLTVENLTERVLEMLEAVSIPIIVDCDEGHGSALNTLRLIKRLERLGVQGICIEDNLYPKANSFYESSDIANSRLLENPEKFCQKINIIKNECPEITVIARTEALIMGLSLDEAIKRGALYLKNGADFILIHSKYIDLSQFEELTSRWKRMVDDDSIIIIPSSKSKVDLSQLKNLGFKMVIYPNQALRASIYAMDNCLKSVVNNQKIPSANQLVSMDDVFEIMNMNYASKLTYQDF